MSTRRLSPARSAQFAALYPYLLLTFCMLCWSGNWVLGRAVRDIMPPAALTFWRWAISAACLAPLAIPRLRGKGALLKRHWRLICGLGFLGVGFFQVAVYTGLHYTTAINAVLMNAAAPLYIIAIAWLLDGERVTPRQLLGMMISFLGIIVIISHGDLTELLRLRVNIGDLIVFLAMPAWGLYCVLLRRVPKALDTIGLLFAINVVGVMMVAPFYAAESVFIRAPELTWLAAGAALYIGIFASFIAYICWNKGIELVGPNKAGFTTHLLPAFATVLAVMALGEKLHIFHLVGIAVILFGVILASTSTRKPAFAAPPPD